MTRAPSKLHEQFLDKVQLLRVLYVVLVISLGALFLYAWMLEHYTKEYAVSTLFTAIIISTWMNGLHARK